MIHPAQVGPALQLGALTTRYVVERRRRGEISRATAQNLSYVLTLFARSYGARPVDRLSKRDVERWMESIGHLAPGTRRNQLNTLRGFCRWLVDNGHIGKDPTRTIKAPKPPRSVPRALPPDDVSEALRMAADQRARLMIVLMVQQGLRRAEVAGLEVGDIDRRNRQMRVIGKGGHERFVYVTDQTLVELAKYLGQYPATDGPLIRSYHHDKRGITPTMVGRIVGRALYDAGVKRAARDGVSGHALRHTAATDMLRNGAPVRDVQQVLGHAHLTTTERYLPRMVGTLRDAMEGRSYG